MDSLRNRIRISRVAGLLNVRSIHCLLTRCLVMVVGLGTSIWHIRAEIANNFNQAEAKNEQNECGIDGIRRQISILMEGLPEDLRQVVGRSSSGTGAAMSVLENG
ncbi:unnamed protein product [Rodentolepis nana]|uniref:Uncharacterized protein n=1 Tax=Rodentolepis nana TaxID=102285 RepID=A0A0R3T2V6_RODNA|nr:unnamed protein product [Rodentolepis nana]